MTSFEWIQRFKTKFAQLTNWHQVSWEKVARQQYEIFWESNPEEIAESWHRYCTNVSNPMPPRSNK